MSTIHRISKESHIGVCIHFRFLVPSFIRMKRPFQPWFYGNFYTIFFLYYPLKRHLRLRNIYIYLDIVKLLKWIVGNQTLIDRIWDMNSLIHDTIMVRQDLSFFEYLLIDGYTNSPWHIQNVGATSYDFSYRVRDFAPHYNFCRHIKLQKTHLVIVKVLPLEILQFCLFAFEDVF